MKDELYRVLQPFQNITFALLFGSYADNTQTFLSDVDIAIYSDESIDLFTQGEIIASLEYRVNKKVDLVSLNDLYKSNPRLSFNITNNHQVIFCNNNELYIDFKTESLKHYFDVKYMLDMFDNALKERLLNGTYGKTQAS